MAEQAQMPGGASPLTPCVDGSDEHLLICQVMEELESLCQMQFGCFMVLGYTKQVVAGTIYQVKIKVAEEGATPIVHAKVMQFLPHTNKVPEVMAFKANQTEDAPFDFGDLDQVMRTQPIAEPGDSQMQDESSQQPAAAEEPAQPQGKSISSMVNQTEVGTLMDMGFSKNVSEKALFMVQNAGIERAMGWIDQNRGAADFEEPLMIVEADPNAEPAKVSQFAGLSKEEKAAKIKELQTQARAKRQAEDRKNAAENEANRVRMDKELAAAKRIADEQEIVRQMEARKAEKAELAREKARMREILERDKRERFGGKAMSAAEEAKNKKTPQQLVEHGIKTVKTLYTDIRAPGVAKTCLKTVCTFIKNLQKDSSNEKFRKVNLENQAVQTRVAKINGGLAILKAVGFKQADDGSCLLYEGEPDMDVLQNAIDQLTPNFD